MRFSSRTRFRLTLFPFLIIPLLGAAAPPPTAAVREAQAQIERAEYAAAARTLQPLADADDPAAQAKLGMLLYLGRGVPRDEARAYALFTQAAGKESAEAMFWLGRMHLLGDGPAAQVADADREAARWYFEAGRRGHAEAQYTLGLLFMAGTGVEKNEDEARRWIRRAADAGFEEARKFLAK